jgi:hypothetical protein
MNTSPHKKQKLDLFNENKFRNALDEHPIVLFSQRDDIHLETILERYPNKINWGSLSS